jgi:hypothetical protein
MRNDVSKGVEESKGRFLPGLLELRSKKSGASYGPMR